MLSFRYLYFLRLTPNVGQEVGGLAEQFAAEAPSVVATEAGITEAPATSMEAVTGGPASTLAWAGVIRIIGATPNYWSYPYFEYPYTYPYYGYPYYYNPYPYTYNGPYPAQPPVTSQPPQGQNQPASPQKPPDDPAPVVDQNIGLWEPGLGDLLSDPDVRQQLGVAVAQAAKIQQQDSDFVKTQIRNMAELQIKRMELDDLVLADKPDRSAIDRKLQEIDAAQVALEKSDIDTFLTAQEALTPVQRQKLRQMMTEKGEPAPEDKAARPGAQTGARPDKQQAK